MIGLTSSHLSVVMATTVADETQTTERMTSSFFVDNEFYFELAVVLIGTVGTAGNALVLYALVASGQHRKHLLIFNQNALDLASCLSLALVYAVRMFNLHLTGALGHWLCVALLSDYPIWCGTNGSAINLASIAVDRYLKVVHPIWSRKHLRPCVIYTAMAFAWVASIAYNTIMVVLSSRVHAGKCYGYSVFAKRWQLIAYDTWYIVSFYFVILAILVVCYWRILAAVRRRASAMADRGGLGSSSAAQARLDRVQSGVIKTMITVSAFYAVAWLPANVYYLLTWFQNLYLTFIDARYYVTVFVAFLYVCANPFIYAAKFDAVRKTLVDMIPCSINLLRPDATVDSPPPSTAAAAPTAPCVG